MNFASYGIINAHKYPDKNFLIECSPSQNQRRVLSWKEFNDQANLVANYLKDKLEIKKGDFVLHLQMNSLEWMITYHAILRTGAVAVPLNFRFASSDINYAAEASKPKAFILSDGFLEKVEPIKGKMETVESYICIGNNAPDDMVPYTSVLENSKKEDLLVEVEAEDPAELMFTSGTTGPPKPVCQAHKTLYEIGLGNALAYSEGHETVYLAAHPLYHSGSLFLSFPSYLAGGTIVLLLDLSDPSFLIETIANEKINNGWVTVPTMSDSINAIKKGKLNINDYDLSAVTGSVVIGAQPVPSLPLKKGSSI